MLHSGSWLGEPGTLKHGWSLRGDVPKKSDSVDIERLEFTEVAHSSDAGASIFSSGEHFLPFPPSSRSPRETGALSSELPPLPQLAARSITRLKSQHSLVWDMLSLMMEEALHVHSQKEKRMEKQGAKGGRVPQ